MAWLSVILVGACLGVALVHGVRALRGGGQMLPAELSHLAMALGMAAMFTPRLDPLPRVVWMLVFVATAVGALGPTLRERGIGGEPGHRLVGAITMLFMLLAGHQDGGSTWRSTVAIVLAGSCGWHALRCADRVREGVPVAAGAVSVAASRTRLVDVGHVAVAAVMAFMVLGAV